MLEDIVKFDNWIHRAVNTKIVLRFIILLRSGDESHMPLKASATVSTQNGAQGQYRSIETESRHPAQDESGVFSAKSFSIASNTSRFRSAMLGASTRR